MNTLATIYPETTLVIGTDKLGNKCVVAGTKQGILDAAINGHGRDMLFGIVFTFIFYKTPSPDPFPSPSVEDITYCDPVVG